MPPLMPYAIAILICLLGGWLKTISRDGDNAPQPQDFNFSLQASSGGIFLVVLNLLYEKQTRLKAEVPWVIGIFALVSIACLLFSIIGNQLIDKHNKEIKRIKSKKKRTIEDEEALRKSTRVSAWTLIGVDVLGLVCLCGGVWIQSPYI